MMNVYESRCREEEEMLDPESWNLENVMVRDSDDGVTPSNTATATNAAISW